MRQRFIHSDVAFRHRVYSKSFSEAVEPSGGLPAVITVRRILIPTYDSGLQVTWSWSITLQTACDKHAYRAVDWNSSAATFSHIQSARNANTVLVSRLVSRLRHMTCARIRQLRHDIAARGLPDLRPANDVRQQLRYICGWHEPFIVFLQLRMLRNAMMINAHQEAVGCKQYACMRTGYKKAHFQDFQTGNKRCSRNSGGYAS